MIRLPATVAALAVLLFGYLNAAEIEEISGKVVGVHDGDTLTLLVGRRQVKVRLTGIDAPELKGQPYGQAAKQALSERVFGKQVVVHTSERDRYGRTLGAVMLDDRNINLEMVQAGFAWWFRKYAPNALPFEMAEAAARAAKRGLWQGEKPVPPWDWRKNRVKPTQAQPATR